MQWTNNGVVFGNEFFFSTVLCRFANMSKRIDSGWFLLTPDELCSRIYSLAMYKYICDYFGKTTSNVFRRSLESLDFHSPILVSRSFVLSFSYTLLARVYLCTREETERCLSGACVYLHFISKREFRESITLAQKLLFTFIFKRIWFLFVSICFEGTFGKFSFLIILSG